MREGQTTTALLTTHPQASPVIRKAPGQEGLLMAWGDGD